MCGIAGLVDFNERSSREIVYQMTASMLHRGPDGQSEFFEQQDGFQVGLGHRRLSIIDLSHAADQPMAYEGLMIVFNGEIYNYNEIKEELSNKGHQFRTTSDTEVICTAGGNGAKLPSINGMGCLRWCYMTGIVGN